MVSLVEDGEALSNCRIHQLGLMILRSRPKVSDSNGQARW